MQPAPIPESPGTRQSAKESTATADGLGGGERLASTADGSAAALEATVGTAGSSGAKARVADVAPESRAERPAVPEEQTALPEASEGVVGHAIRPPSPQVVPPAVAEEDEVEEIERDEPRPQSIRILRKRDDEVVVVKEEDTTREMRRLKSTIARVMKQIEVSMTSGVLVFNIGDQSSFNIIVYL